MKLPFFVTRQDRELRQRIRYREVLSTVNLAIRQVDKVRNRFVGLLQQAIGAGDETAISRYARICASLDKRIARFKSLSLTLEGLDAVREMLRVDREFISVAKDLSHYVLTELGQVDTAQFQVSFEQALSRAEDFDEQLSDAVDAVGTLALGWGSSATTEEMERKAQEEIDRHAALQERDQELETMVAQEIKAAQDSVSHRTGRPHGWTL